MHGHVHTKTRRSVEIHGAIPKHCIASVTTVAIDLVGPGLVPCVLIVPRTTRDINGSQTSYTTTQWMAGEKYAYYTGTTQQH